MKLFKSLAIIFVCILIIMGIFFVWLNSKAHAAPRPEPTRLIFLYEDSVIHFMDPNFNDISYKCQDLDMPEEYFAMEHGDSMMIIGNVLWFNKNQ